MTRWILSTGLIKPLSLNDRMHWAQKARITRQVRSTVAWNATSLVMGRHDHVHVQLVYTPRDNRRRDTDNLWATAKPAVDGLVDAGIVPDDTARFVTRHEPRITDKNPGVVECRLWLWVWTGDPGGDP